MILSTMMNYDTNLYEPIGVVNGMSIHALSYVRNIAVNITSLFGGKQTKIQDKFMDIRREAIKNMIDSAKTTDAAMIGNVQIEFSEMANEFFICIATGTALRLKTQQISKSLATKKKQQQQLESIIYVSPKK